MIDIEQIEDALYVWVDNVISQPVTFTPSNAPRPGLPYVIIDVSQAVKIGLEESKATLLPNNSIDVDYSSVNDIFLSINTYGPLAFTNATKLRDSLARVTVSDQLWAAGLGFHMAKTVNEIPDIVNKKFEDRAQFDCFFFVRSTDSENIETIRKIEITNELDGSTTVVEHPDDLP